MVRQLNTLRNLGEKVNYAKGVAKVITNIVNIKDVDAYYAKHVEQVVYETFINDININCIERL